MKHFKILLVFLGLCATSYCQNNTTDTMTTMMNSTTIMTTELTTTKMPTTTKHRTTVTVTTNTLGPTPTTMTTRATNPTTKSKTTRPSTATPQPIWPPKGTWTVTDDDGAVCMKMQFSSRLYIGYQNTSNDWTYTSVDVPTTAVTGSSKCTDEGPRYFILHLFNQASFWYLNFTFNADSKYSLSEVGLAWTVSPDIFPNPKDENTRTYQYTQAENFLNNTVPLAKSFTCSNGLIFKLQMATIVIEELVLQPYADHADGDFGASMECRSPDGSSNLPLIIGVSVAAGFLVLVLVAVTLIAVKRYKSGSEDLQNLVN